MEEGKFAEDLSVEGRCNEIETKVQRVVKMLDEEKLDALVLKKHTNYSWITAGEKSWVTMYLESGVATILITKTNRYAITNVIEERRLKEEQELEQLGFTVISQEWYEDNTEEIVRELVGGTLLNTGADMVLGEAKLINHAIDPLRYSLTHNEICRYQHLGHCLSMILEEYIATVKPGMTELEIAGGISQKLWAHNIEQVLFLVTADERAYSYRHGIPTSKVLGKHLCLSVNGRYKGLITTVTRMAHFGKKDIKLQKQYEDTCEIECRSVAAITIGQDDISGYRACKKAYEDLGYADMWRLHGQGGAQGYQNRDYMLTENSHRLAQSNQCYCFNPVIDGTKTEDAFIATTEGPLFVTKPISYPYIEKEINGVYVKRPGLLFVD